MSDRIRVKTGQADSPFVDLLVISLLIMNFNAVTIFQNSSEILNFCESFV